MNNPKVSVIVPNYNHAQFLNQRIDSILNQTYQDFELILLDDCSTDNSREILESYRNNPHVTHIVYNEQNGGSPFAQWNKGIELASGKWIWIAESDDWADPMFLGAITQAVYDKPSCVLAYTWTRYVDNHQILWNPKGNGDIVLHNGVDYIKKQLIFSNCIFNVSMCLFRKETFKLIDQSLYNTMKLCGDWFFYTQLCMNGDVIEIKKTYNNYRQHDESTSNKTECKGLTFLEGIQVLNYCLQKLNISKVKVYKYWGRQWAKYKRKFNFSAETNRIIFLNIYKQNPLIVCFFILYSIKYRHAS